jgi:hypothetical protein
MSGYSQTGQWVVRSGDTIIGPFDGKTPARQYAAKAHRAGLAAKIERLWSTSVADKWIELHAPKADPT